MWVSVAAMMAQPVIQVEWATVSAIVFTTDLGSAFLARAGFLSVAVLICMFFARSKQAHLIAATCFGLALASLAYSGHAAASEGAWGAMHRLNDAVHLLAAALWIGAIGWFLHLTIAAHRQRNVRAGPLLADVHKFAPLGAFLVSLVAVTGVINAQLIFGIPNSAVVVQTTYGWLLALKVLLVCLMLAFGARNAWIGRRHMLSNDEKNSLAKLRVSLGAELTMAVLVIGLMAFIGMMSPMGD
jgi:putative copper resistance protein D